MRPIMNRGLNQIGKIVNKALNPLGYRWATGVSRDIATLKRSTNPAEISRARENLLNSGRRRAEWAVYEQDNGIQRPLHLKIQQAVFDIRPNDPPCFVAGIGAGGGTSDLRTMAYLKAKAASDDSSNFRESYFDYIIEKTLQGLSYFKLDFLTKRELYEVILKTRGEKIKYFTESTLEEVAFQSLATKDDIQIKALKGEFTFFDNDYNKRPSAQLLAAALGSPELSFSRKLYLAIEILESSLFSPDTEFNYYCLQGEQILPVLNEHCKSLNQPPISFRFSSEATPSAIKEDFVARLKAAEEVAKKAAAIKSLDNPDTAVVTLLNMFRDSQSYNEHFPDDRNVHAAISATAAQEKVQESALKGEFTLFSENNDKSPSAKLLAEAMTRPEVDFQRKVNLAIRILESPLFSNHTMFYYKCLGEQQILKILNADLESRGLGQISGNNPLRLKELYGEKIKEAEWREAIVRGLSDPETRLKTLFEVLDNPQTFANRSFQDKHVQDAVLAAAKESWTIADEFLAFVTKDRITLPFASWLNLIGQYDDRIVFEDYFDVLVWRFAYAFDTLSTLDKKRVLALAKESSIFLCEFLLDENYLLEKLSIAEKIDIFNHWQKKVPHDPQHQLMGKYIWDEILHGEHPNFTFGRYGLLNDYWEEKLFCPSPQENRHDRILRLSLTFNEFDDRLSNWNDMFDLSEWGMDTLTVYSEALIASDTADFGKLRFCKSLMRLGRVPNKQAANHMLRTVLPTMDRWIDREEAETIFGLAETVDRDNQYFKKIIISTADGNHKDIVRLFGSLSKISDHLGVPLREASQLLKQLMDISPTKHRKTLRSIDAALNNLSEETDLSKYPAIPQDTFILCLGYVDGIGAERILQIFNKVFSAKRIKNSINRKLSIRKSLLNILLCGSKTNIQSVIDLLLLAEDSFEKSQHGPFVEALSYIESLSEFADLIKTVESLAREDN